MIVYFSNRKMQILGQASTNLPKGHVLIDDDKIEDVESGVATFECRIGFNSENRIELEEMTKAGNYILRSHEKENEFYTIIDVEIDTESQEIYVYAEDAGLDLLNEIAGAYEATESHGVEWYIDKYTKDSGFEIGINEIADTSTRKLSWDGESTVTERLASIATQFGGFEISYSFAIKGMEITNKYINIYKERGKDVSEQLRLNRDIDRIITKKSVANLATAFSCTGGTPEGADDAITLKGYEYDDGDFYVGSDGILRSREATRKWSRYIWNKEPNQIEGYGGSIIRTYSYDTTSRQTLCAHAVTELKKVCDMEVNYEVDIKKLPDNIKIGDRIYIVDDAGELYLSARILKLETSVVNGTYKATLGEYLIKESGISQTVENLAAQFAELAKTRTLYTWFAYADDEEGNGISLDSEGKAYLGTATNRVVEDVDITDQTIFSWSKIKGEDGESGIGVLSLIEQYYLSSSSTTQTGGSWSDATVGWKSGYYIWIRNKIEWSDGKITYTDPVLDLASNSANETAESAKQESENANSTAQSAVSTANKAQSDANAAVEKVNTLEAKAITTDTLSAKVAELGYLKVDEATLKYATITSLNATDAKITALSSKAITTENLTAKVAELGYLKADELEAKVGEFGYLKASELEADVAEFGYLKAATAEATYATITKLNATNANVTNLQSSVASIEQALVGVVYTNDLTAINGNISNLQSKVATIEKAYMDEAKVNTLIADKGYLTEAQIDTLVAGKGYITSLETKNLLANYATIDLANVKNGSITTAMIGTGVVNTAQIADGSITDAKIVALTANKITAGTLSVERLEIRGSTKSIVYALNNITGALQSQNVDTLNGEILTPRTITADKIVANAITANEIAAKTITANEIAANTITAAEIAAGTITATQIKSGTITATQISSGAITTDKLAANAVTAAKINVTDLFAQDISATGSITGLKFISDGEDNDGYPSKMTLDSGDLHLTSVDGNYTFETYVSGHHSTYEYKVTGGAYNYLKLNGNYLELTLQPNGNTGASTSVFKATASDNLVSCSNLAVAGTTTLSGNLTGKYLTGTWLQATATTDLGAKSGKIAVLDASGWLYYRTPEEILSDIGAAASTHAHNYAGSSSVGGAAKSAITLSGLTATIGELNFCDGVTSNIQTQLDNKMNASITSLELKTLSVSNTLDVSGAATFGSTAVFDGMTGFNNTAEFTSTAVFQAEMVALNPYKGGTAYPMYGARVLYSSTSGTNGNVTLSESAANFTWLYIIVGFSDTGAAGSSIVYQPNGKTVDVVAGTVASSSFNLQRVRYAISGTTMTVSNNYKVSCVSSGTQTYSSNTLYCKAVIGFK